MTRDTSHLTHDICPTADDFVVEIANNTALETAELVALKRIGGPMKLSGSNLCYVDRVDWSTRLGGSEVSPCYF